MTSSVLLRGTRVLWRARARRPPGATRHAPMAPGAHWLRGHLSLARADAPEFLLGIARSYGPVVRLRFGPMIAHLVSAPELVEIVLQERHRSFDKQARGFEKLRPVLGNGLLNSEGEFWLRQRRAIQPLFDRRALGQYGAVMADCAAAAADEWQRRRGQEIDVAEAMTRLALRIVGLTLLGTDVTAEAREIGAALSFLLHETNERIYSIFDLREKLPSERNRRYREQLEVLNRAVLRIIRERRAAGGNDLVSQLARVRDEHGAGMSDAQIRDEVMTIFLAGHETTANLLSWTWMLLAQHPAAAERVAAEVHALVGERRPQAADCERLDWTRRVLAEALRLYPPAWFLPRSVVEDVDLDGYYLPKESIVMLSPYVTHRLAQYWPEPERFDPDRFLPERAEGRPKWAYFPFGGGPRVCIGSHFAMLEATLVLATLAPRFRLTLPAGRPVATEAVITLRPRGGLKMVLGSDLT